MNHRKADRATVLLAVCLSVLISMLTPDIFTLLFFYGYGDLQVLFRLGVLGICLSIGIWYFMIYKKRKR